MRRCNNTGRETGLSANDPSPLTGSTTVITPIPAYGADIPRCATGCEGIRVVPRWLRCRWWALCMCCSRATPKSACAVRVIIALMLAHFVEFFLRVQTTSQSQHRTALMLDFERFLRCLLVSGLCRLAMAESPRPKETFLGAQKRFAPCHIFPTSFLHVSPIPPVSPHAPPHSPQIPPHFPQFPRFCRKLSKRLTVKLSRFFFGLHMNLHPYSVPNEGKLGH